MSLEGSTISRTNTPLICFTIDTLWEVFHALVLSLSDKSQGKPSPESANPRSAVLPITRLMQVLVQRFERDNIGQNFDLPE